MQLLGVRQLNEFNMENTAQSSAWTPRHDANRFKLQATNSPEERLGGSRYNRDGTATNETPEHQNFESKDQNCA